MPSTNWNEDFRIPFRNYVLNNLPVNELIGQRFYARQLATLELTADSFPLAVFYPEIGQERNQGIIKRFTIFIRCYSDLHYDQCYEINKAILDCLGGEDGPITIGDGIIIRPLSTVSETFEEQPRIFGVGQRFQVIWKS